MSIFQKVRTVALAYTNDLLDKTINLNSIPVVKQYIRDLEDALAKLKHEAAVAAANVTTLTNQQATLESAISLNKQRAKAYLNAGNETAARTVASRIHDDQTESNTLTQQIETAKQSSQALDAAVEKLEAKHQQMLSQLRTLETKDRSARAMESATSSLKAAAALNTNDLTGSVDNLAQKIEARSDVAKEEFNRTVGEFDTPPDPLKDAAVDDILNSLR